jgi:hypothetical protein
MQTSDAAIERRRLRQGGSALLIVFVFAAFVAIMLYKEMPVVIFEGQRQKEQLLIDRGSEYKRAIKLFVVRNRTFPTSLSQLENFNNVRYIRHRFKDPITGQDEWRLIHVMGPGFVLTDSKVTPFKKPDETKAATGTTAGSGSAAAVQGQSGAPESQPDQPPAQQNVPPTANPVAYVTPGQPVVYHLYPPQASGATKNKPAIAASSFPGQNQAANSTPPQQVNEGEAAATAANMMVSGVSSDEAAQDIGNPAGTPEVPQQVSSVVPVQPANPAVAVVNPQAAAQQDATQQSPDAAAGAPASGMAAVQNMLRRGGAAPAGGLATGSNNTIGAGAIAGVASKATGQTIKRIDGQSDYSKWEFVYDPQKETRVAAPITGSASNAPARSSSSGTLFGNSPAASSSTQSPPPTQSASPASSTSSN